MVARRLRTVREKEYIISLHGPRHVLPQTTVLQVREQQTWANVLNGDLNLAVPLNKGIFVCSASYCPSKPKPSGGWRAELSDTVGNFIRRYRLVRHQYFIRICDPYDISVYKSTLQGNSTANNRPSAPSAIGYSRPLTLPLQRSLNVIAPSLSVASSTQSASIAVAGPSGKLATLRMEVSQKKRVIKNDPHENLSSVESISTGHSMRPKKDKRAELRDDASVITSISEQEAELSEEGIRNRDVKTIALRKLSNVSNDMLLRIEHEMNSSKNRNDWQRNVCRSPLMCWLINEIFDV